MLQLTRRGQAGGHRYPPGGKRAGDVAAPLLGYAQGTDTKPLSTIDHPHPDIMTFHLLETMRLQDGHVVRLDRHIARMAASAAYFAYHWDEDTVRAAVRAAVQAHPRGCWRTRVLLAMDGSPQVECTPHEPGDPRVWLVAFAATPVDADDPFLRNKTTSRGTYEAARRARPDVDDVLLWNGREEVTESTIANVVVEIDGIRYTPPVASGLLPGVFRAELLDTGRIRERVLTRDDVARAPRLWLINSVREWIDAVLAA